MMGFKNIRLYPLRETKVSASAILSAICINPKLGYPYLQY